MTFLELVNKLIIKVGGPNTTVVAVTGQTGEIRDFVNWIAEAWDLIQAEEAYWRWMRADVSFQTTAGKTFYLPSATAGETGITDLAFWHDTDSWRCYRTSTGRTDESFLVPWDYQTWRDTFDFGTQSTIQSKPTVFAIRESDNALLLGNTPDAAYTVTGQYQRTPTTLAANADTPGCPARFHMAIVYRAMQLYGKFESAPEVLTDANEEYARLMAAMRLDQLPRLTFGPPLA